MKNIKLFLQKYKIARFTPIWVEYNNYNGLIIDIFGIDLQNFSGERSLFHVSASENFLYIDLFFTKIIEIERYGK